jgi:uncharacterized membrane protein (UPF0127 family)
MSHRTILHTARGQHPLRLHLADGFISRLRGLMLAHSLPPHEGLLITRCASVHTAFMRFAIDLLYLDVHGTVTLCVPHVAPWRFNLAGLRTQARTLHTLELAAGSIGHWSVQPGDHLEADVFRNFSTRKPR